MRKLCLKIFAFALSCITIISTLVGCDSKSSVDSSSVRVLKVTMQLGEDEWKVMQSDIFPEFEKLNNCKIKALQIDPNDVVTELKAMKDAGKMQIDLVAQDNMALAPIIEDGLVEDLSNYRSIIPSEVIPSLSKIGEFNDKLYFLPYRPNVQINFYNEQKFNEANLKPPTNWDELLTVAKTFKQREGTGRLLIHGTFDANTTTQLFEFIKQAGGDPLVLNDAGSIKAFTFLKELWPYLSTDTLKADWDTTNNFLAKDSSYYGANWPFAINVVVKDANKKEIKANPGFSGPVKASKVLGGEVIGIPVGAKNKDLSIKFAQYLMSKEVQETLVSKLGWPSARNDAYSKVEDWQKPYFEAVNKALETAEARPNVFYWNDVDKALNNALKEIVIDNKDVTETLNKYHDVIEKAKNNKPSK